MITAEIDTVAMAEARAAAYALLAHGFQYPDAEWYELIFQAERWRDWPDVLAQERPCVASLAAEVRRAITDQVTARTFDHDDRALHRFQAAHDALFGHTVSGKCCAYETEYGDSEISQRSAQLADLAGFYQAFGLEAASRDGDRPDFVSVECAFMSVLCSKEAHGRRCGNDDWVDCTVDAQRAFLQDHLARWLPAFTHRVGEAGVDPFYTALSRLGGELVALECARLELSYGPRWLELRHSDPEGETTISCLDATECGPGSVACAPAAGGARFTPLNVDIGGA